MATPGPTPVSDGVIPKRPLRRKVTLKNYDEKLMDEFIERHIGGPLKKKHKTLESIEKETETEAMIAISLGFPIDALMDEEIKAGVVSELGGKEQNDYIVLRNHILSRWRANVGAWLSKGQIRETISNDVEHLMSTAYDFLLYNGFINFGVSVPFSSHIPEEASEGSVVIVGAGLAGLAAARQLLSFGFKVIVLEGRKRPGGRVYTQKMGNKGQFAAVELGGSVITGIHANPLGVLARQLLIPLHKVRGKCPLYKPDGSEIDKDVDSRVESIFNRLLDKVTELRKIMGGFATDISLGSILDKLRELYSVAKSKEEGELLDWHFANLEYANAGCLSELSGAYWDQDDPYEMGGDHCFLAGGNWRLIRALCEGVPILYDKTVHTIRYGVNGVDVVAGDQTFQADIVLCTAPLGVLKRKSINFEPELPKRKLDAINRVGFGLLNKVAMVFPNVFWGEDLDTFGRLSNHSHERGEFFLFYGYHTVSGGAVLVALVAGEAAWGFEQTDPSVLLHRVLNVLRGIYNPKGIDVPNPIQAVCTKWGSDPLSYGSYSHVRVGSTGVDYDILAENVGNRLFFAGEATTRKYPATMHGAFLSGLREAGHIFRTTRALQLNGRKYAQKATGLNFDALFDLFRRPDLELGKFMFIVDPVTGDKNSLGLLKVSFDDLSSEVCSECSSLADRGVKCHEHSCLPLELYAVVSREQVEQLQQVNGGDQDRMLFLCKNLGLKLMGPCALSASANSVVTSLITARRGRGRLRFGTGPQGIV